MRFSQSLREEYRAYAEKIMGDADSTLPEKLFALCDLWEELYYPQEVPDEYSWYMTHAGMISQMQGLAIPESPAILWIAVPSRRDTGIQHEVHPMMIGSSHRELPHGYQPE